MTNFTRRKFLTVVAAGAGLVVASVIIPGGVLTRASVLQASKDKFTFRAVGGLPQGKFPSYASYVMEGTIDLQAHSGVTTTNVFAGPPEAMSAIVLPGLSRTIRITEVDDSGSLLTLRGVVDDTTQLQPGEDSHVEITIDSGHGAATSSFINSEVGLTLE